MDCENIESAGGGTGERGLQAPNRIRREYAFRGKKG